MLHYGILAYEFISSLFSIPTIEPIDFTLSCDSFQVAENISF